MHKVSIYINHRAGRSGADWQYKLERYLFRSELKFQKPKDIPDLQQKLSQDIQEGVDAVISVGGDGTANTLIQTLAGTNVGLLVVPAGTANDLANELGNKSAVQHLVRSIRGDSYKSIDLLSVNGRLMATNGGIGLGETVAERVNQLRTRYSGFKKIMRFAGKNIYTALVAQDLISHHMTRYRVKVSCQELEAVVETPGIFVNNQPVLAGRFKIAPQTCNTDGKFNVVLLTHPTRMGLLHCFARVALGEYPIDDPHFITFETSDLSLEIEQGLEAKFFGDGEVLGSSRHWKIKLIRNGLKVYTLGKLSEHMQGHLQEQVTLL